jgi:hypothetical protein
MRSGCRAPPAWRSKTSPGMMLKSSPSPFKLHAQSAAAGRDPAILRGASSRNQLSATATARYGTHSVLGWRRSASGPGFRERLAYQPKQLADAREDLARVGMQRRAA